MLAVVQNLKVRKIFLANDNIMGSRRENVMLNNKTNLQWQNVVDKNNLEGTEVSTILYSSAAATACS